MTSHDDRAYLPVRHLSVFAGNDFRATGGVNEGDALTDASELIYEDVYELAADAGPARLALEMSEEGRFRIAPGTATGQPGAAVFLDCLLTFMADDGATLEALVFVEVDPEHGTVAQVHLHPLAPIAPQRAYTLVTIDRETGARRLAESAAVAFTRGTHITMGDGRQVPVEDLRPGDRVLTRDSGVQEVRWVGVQTMRAEGAFAPVVIAQGALNNARAFTVSPNHRLFIYQRVDAVGAGQRELLVKAGLLVNGTTVTRSAGGFVDYVQVLFDKHEVIYAEGIAAESLFLDTTTRPALPHDVTAKLNAERPSSFPLGAVELRESDVARRPDMVEMLRRVSAM